MTHFGHKNPDPGPDSLEMLNPYPDPQHWFLVKIFRFYLNEKFTILFTKIWKCSRSRFTEKPGSVSGFSVFGSATVFE
jgi:hypothetical protein